MKNQIHELSKILNKIIDKEHHFSFTDETNGKVILVFDESNEDYEDFVVDTLKVYGYKAKNLKYKGIEVTLNK